MEPKDAREILINHVKNSSSISEAFPSNDQIVYTRNEEKYSFTRLLCIAYKLQPKTEEGKPSDISPNQTTLF